MGALLLATLCSLADPPPTEAAQLRILVHEAANSELVACRIHLVNQEGQAQTTEGLPFFHDHFVCDGSTTISLAPGKYTYEVERGPEYELVMGELTLAAGQHYEQHVTLRRIVDLPARGWYPGDLHIHRPVEDIEPLMRAEDLYVAPVITWWNQKSLWEDRAVPENPLVQFDARRFYHVMSGEDERNGGAFLYFGRSNPLAIRDAQKEWPSPIAFLESRGDATWIDIEKPFWWDVPVALAHGIGNSIGVANNHMCRSSMYETEAWGHARDEERLPPPRGNGFWSQEIYYHILNCGFRIPPSAGSASGVLPNPVGYNRVYVHVPGDLTYEKWWEALRAGRCFVTNGPLLLARANGELPGHVFQSNDPIEITLTAEMTTRDPIRAIEVVKNGAVTNTVSYEDWKTDNSLGALRFDESGWFLIRAIADVPHTFRFASTGPYYVEIGDGPKRISRHSAQFFLDWVQTRAAAIQVDDPGQRAEVTRYHDAAITFWRSIAERANAD